MLPDVSVLVDRFIRLSNDTSTHESDDVQQVTHAFPFPTAAVLPDGQPAAEDMDGQDYQMEMMKMLREVGFWCV